MAEGADDAPAAGDEPHLDGAIHISEDVIVELTRKTIQGIDHIQTVDGKIGSKFGIGRRGGGIRVVVDEGEPPKISIDAYVLVRYGQRIPDLAWDVQEKVKANLERYTGYDVSAVNINVQGIWSDEPIPKLEDDDTTPDEGTASVDASGADGPGEEPMS